MTDPPAAAGRATVIINFPCDSMSQAQSAVDGWTLSPDCTVTLNYTETAPGMTDDEGTVVPVPPPEQPEG